MGEAVILHGRRDCALCRQEFYPFWGKQKYCSPEHAELAHWVQEQNRNIYGGHGTRKVCVVCGEPFIARYHSLQQTCCAEHSALRRRARKHRWRKRSLAQLRHQSWDEAVKRASKERAAQAAVEAAAAIERWKADNALQVILFAYFVLADQQRRYSATKQACQRAYYADPVHHQHKLDYDRAYRATHKVERSERAREYNQSERGAARRERSRLKARERHRQIVREHPELHAAMKQKARWYYHHNAAKIIAANKPRKRRWKLRNHDKYKAQKRRHEIRLAAKNKILRELGIARELWPLYRQAIDAILKDATGKLPPIDPRA